jgi:hypothetical protein
MTERFENNRRFEHVGLVCRGKERRDRWKTRCMRCLQEFCFEGPAGLFTPHRFCDGCIQKFSLSLPSARKGR